MTNETMDYAPFPEQELEDLAEHFENIGRAWSPNTTTGARLRQECMDRAEVCRNAIKSHAAVRERMLVAELLRDTDPDATPEAEADGSSD